ncbi:LOW QUALITY PROTEIN: Golgi-associated kinase 1B-like [Myxocyprinus asiaticus]|uniref:LOW QUALITY PROTEIN: Golgi-associated kinase 1B-like n=1 Tax=Myxocyprinus asiaticus TaxID=70543 RepID=UPI0022230A8F|nr:LOW QUALITY PROTEIN: Golgi-associated kinase 1B-like [Myxocyprinus asiaticus]
MDTYLTRPENVGGKMIYCSKSFLKVCNCCRRYSAFRKYLIIAIVCFVYLFFTVHVSHASSHQDKSSNLWRSQSKTDQHPTDGVRDREANESFIPTRSNVVYITLKSKRHKPAVIRGTVRPKLRRKKVKVRNQGAQDGTLDEANKVERHKNANISEKFGYSEQLFHKMDRFGGSDYSAIRIYSERAPPWFSNDDIAAMRFLADSKITHIEEVTPRGFSSLILFKSVTNHTNDADGCRKCCGVVKRPLDMSEVFAYHLDRVLGLNRTLPTVSRRFHSLGDGQPCPVVLWDSSISPVVDPDQPSEKLTWSSYQASLKYKCWHQGVIPKPEWSCTSIHHHEWSKLVVFDFLLQIYERLDRKCCGFKPRPEDTCVELGHHGECRDKDSTELTHIVHRRHDPHHLVFFNNKGYFDRDEENLDFKLLEGIKELPDQSVSVLRSQRLREKLLQSLFLDQQYWESQGGRQGIEKLIDVIERRAKVLLTYINAHGIKVVPMNS